MGQTGNIISRMGASLRGFLRDRRGNVAMMFGIALVPLAVAAGIGLDFARAMMVRSSMNEALDAAGLAIASSTGLDRTKAQELAQKYFDANYKGTGKPVVTISSDGYNKDGSVTLNVSGSVPTTLMRLANYQELPVKSSATVVWGQTKLWVSLVLDNSGSMANGDKDGSKMDALKNAAVQLLGILKKAASKDGDVQVSVVPFTQAVNVGTGNASAAWLDWTDWEAAPVGYTPPSTLGPGSDCPFNNSGSTRFYCTTGPSNSASTTSKIPSSGSYKGYICPGMGYGDDHHRRYFNGCWDSVATQTKVETQKKTTPITTKQTCSQTGSGSISCSNQNGYPDEGNSSTTTATTYTNGYSSDSDNTTTDTTTDSTSDGTKSCSGSGSKKKCTWTRTIKETKTETRVIKTAYNFTHTWKVNARSTWGGCLTDREKTNDSDISSVAPSGSSKFPASNPSTCLSSEVRTMGYDWSGLEAKINSMSPAGATNQTIGFVHGWQTLANSAPYSPGAVPGDTARYVILFSDGLNTLNRWWGDGSTENTTEDGYIDDRLKKACDAAKADSIVIYSIYLNVGGSGNSGPLEYCASDSTKYFPLNSTGAVVTAFQQIGKDITNVHVSR